MRQFSKKENANGEMEDVDDRSFNIRVQLPVSLDDLGMMIEYPASADIPEKEISSDIRDILRRTKKLIKDPNYVEKFLDNFLSHDDALLTIEELREKHRTELRSELEKDLRKELEAELRPKITAELLPRIEQTLRAKLEAERSSVREKEGQEAAETLQLLRVLYQSLTVE